MRIDLEAEHERYLTDQVFKLPLVITDFPIPIKSFAVWQNDDGKTKRAFNLLVPGIGEIVDGARAEERQEMIEKDVKRWLDSCPNVMGTAAGLYLDQARGWYADRQRYGPSPMSGMGAGFDRLVMACTGIDNIRDVVFCPRCPQEAEC